MKTTEYFIGLKKDGKSGEWRWISHNSKVNAIKGNFHWARGQPSGDGTCAVMYKDYMDEKGKYNDVSCTSKQNHGYICESPANSSDRKGRFRKLSFSFRFTFSFFFLSNR